MDIQTRKDQIEKNRFQYKLTLLKEMIEHINIICKELQIEYIVTKGILDLAGENALMEKDCNDYKISLVGNNYTKFVEELEKRYGTGKDGITFHLKEYFFCQEKYPKIVMKRSFPEEVGSKDISVSIHVEQLSYLPETKAERDDYYRKIEKGFYKSHKKIAFLNRVTELFSKGKKKTSDVSSFTSLLRKQDSILNRYSSTSYLGNMEQGVGEIFSTKDILPAQKSEFMGQEIMIPNHPDPFLWEKKDLFEKERLERKRILLQKFDELCKKQGIEYFVVKDLLISIISEGQFPKTNDFIWSVGLFRKEYDRLLALLKRKDSSQELLLMENDHEHPTFPDLVKRITLNTGDDLLQENLYIEILPYDHMTDNYEETFRFRSEIRALINRHRNNLLRDTGMKINPKERQSMEETLGLLSGKMKTYNKKDCKKVFQASTEISKSIPVNEIYPIQKKDWNGIEVSLPYNPYIWAEDKDPGYTEYLSEGKTKVLKMLDALCKEQGIPYFATADLLIGAYVYKDVIPFGGTKSFSIGLLRSDYEKLLEFLRKHGEAYGLQLNESRDMEGKYPMLTKHVTLAGRNEWLMMVRLHPYDKVPASFYTKKAFLDQIKRMNQDYEEALNFKLNTVGKYKDIYTASEIQAKREKYKSADLVKMAEELDQYAQKYNEDPNPEGYQRIAFAFSGKVATEENVSHTITLPFRDMDLVCLGDVTPWYQPMNGELSYQIETLQRENKKLLVEFDRVCKEMGIGYFICAGTLLGCMRHGGFIPWDDDTDVGMLREDYDKLLEKGPEYFGSEFFLQTRESDPNIPYVYSKLRLNNTEYFTDFTYDRDMHKGIGLDIFPFDYVPNDMKKRESLIKEVTKLSLEHNAIVRNQYPEKPVPFPPRNEEEIQIEKQEKAMIADYWKKSLKESQQAYLDKATKYNAVAKKQNLKTVASFVISYTCINIEDLLPYGRAEFAGIEVSVPKYPHALMSMQYGNYMEYPLKHQRVSHKVVKWSAGEDGSEHYKEKMSEKN
ncbi:MAG: LicD family protein [Eubacteriales bacterium]|nr:LicD family protein [Eubacteriales bacterium]